MALDVANLGFKVDSSALVKAKTDIDGLANAAGKAAKPIAGVGDAAGRAGAGVGALGAAAGGATSAGMSRFANEARNVSYQIQDMAVQISMGTSVMTTMGQQLPQLLGGFGLWGAAIGAVVAVGAGLAPMLLSASNGGEKLSDVMRDLAGAQAAYADAAEASRTSLIGLADEFGRGAIQAREMYGILRDIALLEFQQKMAATATAVQTAFEGMDKWLDLSRTSLEAFNAGLRDEAAAMYRQTIEGLKGEFGLTVVQAQAVASALEQINNAATPLEQSQGFRELATTLLAAADNGAKIPPELIEAARASAQAGLEGLRLADAIEQASNNTGVAIDNTNSWAVAMSGVAAQINAIASALSSIGGGMLSRVSMYVERNALAAGKTVAQARVEVEKFKASTEWDAQIMGARAKGGIFGAIQEKALEAAKAVDLSNIEMAAENAILVQNAQKTERAAGAKAKKAKGSKAEAKATRDLIGELNKELDAREALIGLYGEERERVEALQQVQRKLGDDIGKYSAEAVQGAADRIVAVQRETKAWEDHVSRIDGLVDDLAGAWGDWIAGGLRDFKDFASDILNGFKRMISEMIATAAANPIRLAITGAMGGMGGPAAAGVPGIPGGGILGGIGKSIGTAISGTMSGFGSVFSGLMSGGLSGGIGAIGTALSGATSGLAGLATAAGAIAAPLAAVAAVFSFFKSKTTELDRGLRVTVDGMDALVETFRKTETRRFWGLSKKRRTSYEEADAEIADPIESAIGKVQQSVLDMAASIGTGSEAFETFAYQFKLSTKDMTDEQALQAIQEEIGKFGDAFADMVPGLRQYQAEGEGAAATLTRLSNSLTVVNSALGDLGLQLFQVGLKGAGAASALADLFGGLDQFVQASSAYYEAFYSDAERFARLQEVSNKAIRDAGLAVPATREAYRRLVEAQDLTTEAGRKAAAVLLQLAPAFDQIYDAANSANAVRAELIRSSLTDEQRAAHARSEMRRVFADLGVAVPETAGAYRDLLRSLDLTTASGRAAMESIGAVGQVLLDSFDAAARAAASAAEAQRQSIADANAARAGLLDSLLTDQQRAAQAQAEITATFAALNLTVPTTLDGLRAIIAGLDLTGEAGRDALARIAGIADELKEKLTPAEKTVERATSGGGSSGRDGVAEERERLERQLLQLQGNTAELRRRELAALNPANRALQEMVWRLEDAKAAMDNLSTDKFATLVDYELARSRQAHSANSPAAVTPEKKAEEARQRQDSAVLIEMRDYMRTSVNEIHRLVRETREMRMLQEGGAP